MGFHPGQAFLRCADCQPGQPLVRVALGHPQQIVEIFIFCISIRQNRQRPLMHTAEIPCVARIAAAIGFRGAFQDDHPATGFGRFDGRAQGCVSTADNDDIPHFIGNFRQGFSPSAGRSPSIKRCRSAAFLEGLYTMFFRTVNRPECSPSTRPVYRHPGRGRRRGNRNRSAALSASPRNRRPVAQDRRGIPRS